MSRSFPPPPTPDSAPAPRLPVEAVPAGPMDTGVAAALVDLGQAGGAVVALGAVAREAVDAVLTGAPVVAGVARALVDVHVAHAPCGRGGGGSSDTHAPGAPEPLQKRRSLSEQVPVPLSPGFPLC